MFKTFETTDFDELTAAEEGWDIHHRPVRPAKFEGRITVARVGGIGVDLESWSTATELTGTSPRQAVSFVLPCEDAGSYVSSGTDVNADCIDLFGPGCEIHALLRSKTSLISCSIAAELLEKHANGTALEPLTEEAEGHRVIPSNRQTTVALRRLFKQFLNLARNDELPSDTDTRILDEVSLLSAGAISFARDDVGRRTRRRYKLARRARDYMLERRSDPPSIAEICSFVSTSERTLHYAFIELYEISPKRFLKTQRLFAANQALKRAPAGTRVSDIALGFGFWELGHFARDYRAMFGEPPSTTLTSACFHETQHP